MPHGLPETMRAAVIDEAGPPNVIQLRTVPVPRLTRDHVVIALDYASAGSWDAQTRSGAWGDVKKGTILGADGSGRVAAVSSDVHRLKVGDRVYSYSYDNPHGGFYAEYVSVPAERVELVPEQIDQKVAGAIPCVGLTAHAGLLALNLKNEWQLGVYGASGGVGSTAVWLGANSFDAVVTATGRPDTHQYLRRLGATHAIDHHSTLRGVPELDAAFVTANGDTLEKFLSHLREGAPFSYPNGVEPEPELKGHKAIGVDGGMSRSAFEEFNAAIGAKTIPLHVEEYTLDRVVDAHERLDQGHVVGKIVLKVR